MKRSVRVEADGGPLALVIAGANVHDTKLLAATLEAIVVERPAPTPQRPQHLCLDKAYDNPTGEEAVAAHGYVPHIRRIGEEKLNPATGEMRFLACRSHLQLSRLTATLSLRGRCTTGPTLTGMSSRCMLRCARSIASFRSRKWCRFLAQGAYSP